MAAGKVFCGWPEDLLGVRDVGRKVKEHPPCGMRESWDGNF